MVQTDLKSSRSMDQIEYLLTGMNVNTNVHFRPHSAALLEQCMLTILGTMQAQRLAFCEHALFFGTIHARKSTVKK